MFVHTVREDSVMVLNVSTGEQVLIEKDGSDKYDRAVELIKAGDPGSIFTLTPKAIVSTFLDGKIKIENGVGIFTSIGATIHPSIVKRILKMESQGVDSGPMLKFVDNLYANPSKTAIDELFLFIEACNLPITEDGCFIAYKIVRNDYKDIYTGTIDNSVGKVVSMPRQLVDDKRENTCSQGLHFCSREYLPHYGTTAKSTDRCILVKINPMDVVSIPSDYNNAKGRTWRYEVVGEMPDGWRTELADKDFTDSAVYGYSKNDDSDAFMVDKIKMFLDDLDISYEVTDNGIRFFDSYTSDIDPFDVFMILPESITREDFDKFVTFEEDEYYANN